jgi:hypothetical protein
VTYSLTAPVTTAENLVLASATTAAGAQTITVGGSWLNYGGGFTPMTSTATLNGAGTNVVLSGGRSFNNLNATGTGSWTLLDAASVNGNFIQSNGSVTAGKPLTVTGTASLQNGTLSLITGGQIRMGSGSTLSIGDTVGGAASAILSASGLPKPRITTSGTAGTNFYGFTVNGDGRLNVSGLEIFSTNTSGVTLNVGATLNNGTAGTISGVDFDFIQSGGTYLRFLPTTGNFFFSNGSFGNSGAVAAFNISTPGGTNPASLLVDARTNNTGVLASSVFESDHGAGQDDAIGTSTIKWLLPPNAPSTINQYLLDATTVIPVGSGTNAASMFIQATTTDPETDTWRLDVELRLVGTPFTNTATVSSAFVASGGTAQVSSGAIAAGNYHWQYRLVDSTGRSTAWTSFGANLESATDFARDITAPTVSSVVRANADPTNAASVNYTVTFSEPVTGVTAASFSLTTTGVGGASIGAPSGSGTTWTVPVNTGAGSGTIRLDVTAAGTITDLSSNALGGLPFTTGQVYTIDKTAPTVSSIVLASANPTNAASVNFTVTFSESGQQRDRRFVLAEHDGRRRRVHRGAEWLGHDLDRPGEHREQQRHDSPGCDRRRNRCRRRRQPSGRTSLNTGQTYTVDKTAPTVSSVVRAGASRPTRPA